MFDFRKDRGWVLPPEIKKKLGNRTSVVWINLFWWTKYHCSRNPDRRIVLNSRCAGQKHISHVAKFRKRMENLNILLLVKVGSHAHGRASVYEWTDKNLLKLDPNKINNGERDEM